jgi:enoyl-CoA hydratase/carnithine racemase
MGIMGVEYQAHTWELGARKAKEMLFTASSVTAEEALRSGMVNHVVPLDELPSFTMALAHRVAHDAIAVEKPMVSRVWLTARLASQTDPWALRERGHDAQHGHRDTGGVGDDLAVAGAVFTRGPERVHGHQFVCVAFG